MDNSHPRKRIWLWILAAVLLLLAAGGLWFFLQYWSSGTTPLPGGRTDPSAATTPPVTGTTVPAETTTTAPLPDNPVDFKTLQTTNPDVYAWLYIPNTNIDYPVAQSSDMGDDFYLDHNIYREYEFAGMIFSEKQNGRTFLSRNTVLYGHNMLNGTMFRTLHYFEDEEFFNANPVFYIYTPGHILTYTIFSAYEYDDRHLLNSFDYHNDQVWEEYLAYARNPKSMVALTRPDVPVTKSDRIVTLSTCVGYNGNMRYLVQGVLTDDQPTK
ncbi:MAG: class B sortase [Clostridia bacterium]|nr:class B sortase [Clostridia bacterium]